MQLIAAVVSACVYCGSRVVASPLWLSRTDPYAKKAGQPFGQPLAAASPVGVVFVCSTVTYALVAVAPVKAGNIDARFVCTWPSGESGCENVLPICAPFVPLKSFTSSVVLEYCDAFTMPMLPRYAGVLRRPVMKTLSRPTGAASEETKLYQGRPEKS